MIREDSLQTLINSKTGDTVLVNIKWLSDCEYEMSRKLPPRPANDTSDIVYSPIIVPVKIIECRKDFYVCEIGKTVGPVFPAKIDTIWVDK
jgi:hypothetical protein